MAKILHILCHPRPGSFNHALALRIRETLAGASHTEFFHDLYEERFDPVLRKEELDRRFSFEPEVQRFYGELREADGIVIVHPDWWGRPPALLAGWVDRVFRPGIAYEYEGEDFEPKRKMQLLSGKKACVFCTSDAGGIRPVSYPLVRIWKEAVFGYCGAEARVRLYSPLRGSDPARRERWLGDAAGTVLAAFPPEVPERK